MEGFGSATWGAPLCACLCVCTRETLCIECVCTDLCVCLCSYTLRHLLPADEGVAVFTVFPAVKKYTHTHTFTFQRWCCLTVITCCHVAEHTAIRRCCSQDVGDSGMQTHLELPSVGWYEVSMRTELLVMKKKSGCVISVSFWKISPESAAPVSFTKLYRVLDEFQLTVRCPAARDGHFHYFYYWSTSIIRVTLIT